MPDLESPAPTLDEIARNLPPPDPELAAAFFGDSESLVELGAQIASARIVTDARRVYGNAYLFWAGATPAQKEKLVGVSPELLALAVAHAIRLRDLPTESDPAQEKRAGELRAAFGAALTLRDQGHRALRDAALSDQGRREAADAAVGTAETPAALADGLEKLGSVLTSFIASTDPGMVVRLRLARLDASYASKLTSAATDLRTRGEEAKAPGGAKIAQAARDRLDGENLVLLGQVIRSFESAHDRDSTIPRLAPIATRRLLGRKRAHARVDPAAPPKA